MIALLFYRQQDAGNLSLVRIVLIIAKAEKITEIERSAMMDTITNYFLQQNYLLLFLLLGWFAILVLFVWNKTRL